MVRSPLYIMALFYFRGLVMSIAYFGLMQYLGQSGFYIKKFLQPSRRMQKKDL